MLLANLTIMANFAIMLFVILLSPVFVLCGDNNSWKDSGFGLLLQNKRSQQIKVLHYLNVAFIFLFYNDLSIMLTSLEAQIALGFSARPLVTFFQVF